MAKKSVIGVLIISALLGACSLSSEQSSLSGVTDLEVRLTGDPAVDTSIQSLPLEELRLLGLIDLESKGATISDNSSINVYAYAYGPLNDKRAVRGQKLLFNASIYGAQSNATFSLAWGYTPQSMNRILMLSNNGTTIYRGLIDVPVDASDKIYYKIIGQDGTVYMEKDNRPYRVDVFNYIFSYSFSGNYHYYTHEGSNEPFVGWIYFNYAGPAVGPSMLFHYGFNNWQNVTNQSMRWITNTDYYYPANYGTITFEVQSYADYLDFVFYGNGIWDNNNGSDYHIPIKPLVTVTPNSVYNGLRGVSVSYANGTLGESTFMHYGINGWQAVQDTKMYRMTYQGMWLGYNTAYVQVSEDISVIDMAFFDTNRNWENNYGKDWHFKVDYSQY